jgi:ribonuclease HII
MIVGVDEAGRGPLCGPVVACAFYFKRRAKGLILKDSKKLSHFRREELFGILTRLGIFSLSFATPKEVDKYNILGATNLCFERAIEGVIKKYPRLRQATFIIDGNNFKTDLKIKYSCIEKADEKIREVASASILAKFFRDYLMGVLDFIYPEWHFGEHKGYPTRYHRELLKKIEPTPFHRKSFSL